MARKSELDHAIEHFDREIATMRQLVNALEQAREQLLKQRGAVHAKRVKRIRTKLPKPGALRDIAILGGEPSL